MIFFHLQLNNYKRSKLQYMNSNFKMSLVVALHPWASLWRHYDALRTKIDMRLIPKLISEPLLFYYQLIYPWHKNIVAHIYKIWLIKAKLKKNLHYNRVKQILNKKLIKIYINILKPSLKKIQNIGIKKDGKIDAEEQVKWNQHDHTWKIWKNEKYLLLVQ